MATITIRGTEYELEIVTDAIARTISQHVDNTIPLSVRHQSTWDALNACLEPALPPELFKKGILVLNDAEIVPILQAIATALATDEPFKQSLSTLADVMPMDEGVKDAIALLGGTAMETTQPKTDALKSTAMTAEEKEAFLSKLSALL